jgi:hypothetical protein
MFGINIYNPDEDFNDYFDSLVVIQEIIYPPGMNWYSDYYPFNEFSDDLIFARPIRPAGNTQDASVQFTFLAYFGWGWDYTNRPSYAYATSQTTTFGLHIIIARRSKTLNRNLPGHGIAIRDASGKVVFNSEERYLKLRTMGFGFGYSSINLGTIQGSDKTFICLNVMANTSHGIDSDFAYGYTGIFKPNNTIQIYSTGINYSGTPYVADLYGHYLFVDI